ncbi:MAG: DUF3553 domain-containing protein [Deltaproteobacteria bacterium]|nr:DUF3553 domain-containing protein [Deltaproteobacteria bacterium]
MGLVKYNSKRRLYLSVGEEVIHTSYPEWGVGHVIEEMNSMVPGGISLVRIEFSHAGEKTFNNDIDSDLCCYFAGIRRH